MQNDYELALQIATESHKGQKRRNGDEYITHPIRVANSFKKSDDLKIIAILHDVVEDTTTTVLDLAVHFDEHIISAIIALTRHKDENYYDFIMRCKKNKLAKIVKISDINDNLTDLKAGNQRDKYNLAKHLLEEND